MPNECPECENGGVLYKKRVGYRCYKCGYRWRPDGSVADEVPTREADSECGDLISGHFDGVSRAATRKKLCNDGSACSITPSGIVELGNGIFVVACTRHQQKYGN